MTVRDSDTLKSYFSLTKVITPSNYNDLIDTIFAQSTSGEIGDHTHDDRYLQLSIANVVSAVHTFNPSTYSPPFILGGYAQGQTVVGLKADQLNRNISVSGLGLSGGGILDSDRSISLASSSNPGASASILASAVDGTLSLLKINADVIGDRSGSNLTLSPAGDIVLNPVGKDLYPFTNYDLNLGSLSKKFLTLHAAELWVETLVAQDTIATIGGRILVASTTTLTRNLGISDTIMYVKHNSLRTSDVVILQANGFIEFIQITSEPTLTGTDYSYTVTRNLDSTGANQWYAGDAVLSTGQAGSGFIDMYSYESVSGLALDYIYNYNDSRITFSSNFGTEYRWKFFEVDGFPALNDAIYFGVSGKIWQNLHFYIIIAGSFVATLTWEYWNGSVWTSFTPTTSGSFLVSTGYHSATWDKTSLTGWAATTVNSVSAYWVRLRISSFTSWTISPVQGTRRVRGEGAHWGPTIVGNVRNTTTFNDWSETWAIGNLNGLYGYGTDIYGVGLGKYAASAEYLTIDPMNGIRMYSDGILRTQLSSGIFTINDSGGAAVFTFDASAGAEFTKALTLGASGGIYQGSGTFSSPTTGLKIWNDTGIGRIGGYNSGVLQWYADTDGLLYGGGGNVKITANGIEILPDTVGGENWWGNSYKFVTGGDRDIGGLYAYEGSSGYGDQVVIDTSEEDRPKHVGMVARTSSTALPHIFLLAGSNSMATYSRFDLDDTHATLTGPCRLRIEGGTGATPGLEVDSGISTAHTDGRFGNVFPVYLIHAAPILGLNTYFDGTNWKYGAGSTAHHGGRLSFSHSSGDLTWRVSASSGSAGNNIATENVHLTISQAGDIYTIARTQYSGTSTITGWSSRTFTSILYKKIGKLVYVWWEISGTSNLATTSFSVPYTNGMGQAVVSYCRCYDNATYKHGIAYLASSGATVNLYTDAGTGAWQTTGTKSIYGFLVYEVA